MVYNLGFSNLRHLTYIWINIDIISTLGYYLLRVRETNEVPISRGEGGTMGQNWQNLFLKINL